MRTRSGLLLALALLAICGAVGQAQAHGMRTGYLELDESAPGEVTLRWRTAQGGATAELELALPAGCQLVGASGPGADTVVLRAATVAQLRCQQPLGGQTLRLRGLGPQLSEVVGLATLVTSNSGARAPISHLLTAAEPAWHLGAPAQQSPRRVSAAYIWLGLRHILSGPDHLLFLLLLVLAIRTVRGVLLAETAFTLSHSLSFSATALGWIHVSSAAAEACIALSLLLLALDVERPGVPLLSARRAAGLALLFGLVHGLGFAGGLREVGLPEQAAAWALLGFGVGVELGQVAFLLLLLGLLQLVSGSRALRPAALGLTFAAGGLSAYWLIVRLLFMFGPAGSSG